MITILRKKILTGLASMNGTRVPHKIVVFESDDWGGLRTPSLQAIENISAITTLNNSSPYSKFDTVENSQDVELLLNLLSKFKDTNGDCPKITANFVTANPDFEKIKEAAFNNYFYQPFNAIYNQYYPNENVENVIKKAANSFLFKPQFHGREHVNTALWLQLLQDKEPLILEAFNNKFWGVQNQNLIHSNKTLQATFDRIDADFEEDVVQNITEGLQIFSDFFGFKSKSFIPNNYIWDTKYNAVLKDNDVKYLQGIKIQLFPQQEKQLKRQSFKRIPGKKEKNGIISIVRNGTFEPSFYYNNRKKALDLCMTDIAAAFMWKQPAVISTHRINFVSGLDIKNRDENLKLTEQLIKNILKKWPDVIFMNTEELGALYEKLNSAE